MQKKSIIPIPFILIFIIFIALLNLLISLRVLRDPIPFPTSYWDIRWAVIFAAAFFSVGFLFLMSQDRLLIVFSLILIGIFVFLPVFTIGVGVAYLMLLLLLLIARGSGEHLLRTLLGGEIQNGLERLVFTILLGLGLVMILVMIQGWLHAFCPLVTWLGLGILGGIFVLPNLKPWFMETRDWFSNLRCSWLERDLSGWSLALGILLILWISSWLIALAPAIRYDEMTYHLTGPLFYLKMGGIVPYPEGGMTAWLHYAEMLYTLALQTAGQPLPRLLHLLMGGISALLIFLFGRRLVNARVGIAAAILFLAVPVVGYETATAYIDLFVTAYITAFGFALLTWWQDRNPRWLLLAGVFGGFGLGVKLTAGPMIVGLVGMLIFAILLERHLLKDIPWISAMVGLILILALPWLVRDALWTGDPFYPYGQTILQKTVVSLAPVAVSDSQPSLILRWFERFLRYPIDLVLNSNRYYQESAGGMASALPLLAVPLFLLDSSLVRSVKVVGVSLLAASTVTVGITFLANSGLVRYILPIFPWLAICAALNLEVLYRWLSDKGSGWTGTGLFLIALAYLFSTRLPLIVRLSDNLPQRLPINYVLGRESRDDYLSRNLVVYDAFRFIDSQPDGPHRVLSIGNEFRLYSQTRIDGVYDVAEANQILSTARTPAELARSLAKSGYDYILINHPEVEFRPWKYSDPYPILKETDFLNLYGELNFTRMGVYVYRFHPGGVNLPVPHNLLGNAGFEDLIAGKDFAFWEEHDSVEVSGNAFQGNTSLVLHGPLSDKGYDYVLQRVPVQEDKIYTLGYWLRADQTAIFLMQVRWLNEAGYVISTDEEWENVSSTWNWYNTFCQSPQGAHYAEVYASLGGSESAYVDDVCLAEGQRCPMPGGN